MTAERARELRKQAIAAQARFRVTADTVAAGTRRAKELIAASRNVRHIAVLRRALRERQSRASAGSQRRGG
jgi:hypothetical protein